MIDRNLSAESLFTLAEATRKAGKLEEATALYEQVLAVAPAALEPRVALGNILLQLGRPRRAMAAFEDAIRLDPYLKKLCRDIDQSEIEEVRCHIVLENCAHILLRYPNYAEAHYRKASALLNLGRISEARKASEHALVLNPTIPTYYHVLIHTGRPEQNANAVAALEELAQGEDQLDIIDRATLHFLLARAYEDQGRTEVAFQHLEKGNAIKRGITAYDEDRELSKMQAISAHFTQERLNSLRNRGCPSERPVFVIGMPRSGTTLVEQILASHPEIFGAGELTYFSDLVAVDITPSGFEMTSSTDLNHLGEKYVKKISALTSYAQRIVDKQPLNFLYAGLIHLALPESRIIHIKRDPLDTCYSCYALSFGGDIGFAYKQEELGRYYMAYEALMAHWRRVLPDGAFLEVEYEELVNNFPEQAQRLIKYCGLEWDPRCLQFHETKRTVLTASTSQVRRPMYKSSIGRARPYTGQLTPLREALGLI
jgi:tetratricopeptide (TPR) repeat protein